MRAVSFSTYGGPEVLEYGEVESPSVGPTDVLVAVEACALNRMDVDVREGRLGRSHDLPHVTGGDVAGVVETTGESVSGVRPGDRVIVDPLVTCGECEYCTQGASNRCVGEARGTLGDDFPGGLAEFVGVPASNLTERPAGLEATTAAAVPISYCTAWHMLRDRGEVAADETVLVVGASGGLGTAGVQLAAHVGATVIAATSSERKVERALDRGADRAVDYEEESVESAVREVTDGRGVDLVCDHVGAATWTRSRRCLARGGRLIVAGATTGHEVTADLRHLVSREETVVGSRGWTNAEFAQVVDLVGEGAVSPAFDRMIPLSDALDGIAALEDRSVAGKVVVVP